jgi:hypothetical protein
VKKLEDLKRHLLASVKQLKANPERLEIFIDKGDVRARPGSLSFEYRYTATVWVEEFAGSPDDLVVPTLAWIAVNQPELFAAGERKPLALEAELLDGDTYTLTLTVALTELVRVERRANGLKVTHLPEPDLSDAFDDVPAGTRLWQGLAAAPGEVAEIVAELPRP